MKQKEADKVCAAITKAMSGAAETKIRWWSSKKTKRLAAEEQKTALCLISIFLDEEFPGVGWYAGHDPTTGEYKIIAAGAKGFVPGVLPAMWFNLGEVT